MSRPYACLRQLVAPTNYLVAPRNHLPFRTNVRLRIESADEISSARHAENPDVVGGHAGRKGKRAGQTPVILRLTACRGRISKRDFVSNGRTGPTHTRMPNGLSATVQGK